MAVNLSPVFGVAGQLFDNNGNPLAGGKIFTYAAGTTTNQTTYTSSAGSVAHSNPIVLDGAGRVPSGEIWLTDGLSYKFVVKDSADNLIGSYDNLVGINSNFVNYTNQQEIQTATAGQTVFTLTSMQYQPGTGALSVFVDGVNQYGPGAQYAFVETDSTTVTFVSGLHVGASVKFSTAAINAASYGDAFQISYTPPFTGSVATNVGDKLAQTVSVKDFGAVGDGVADDTAAIQAAINETDGKGLLFPAGSYKVSTIQIDGANRTIWFDEAEIVGGATSSTDCVVRFKAAHCDIYGMKINGNFNLNYGCMLWWYDATKSSQYNAFFGLEIFYAKIAMVYGDFPPAVSTSFAQSENTIYGFRTRGLERGVVMNHVNGLLFLEGQHLSVQGEEWSVFSPGNFDNMTNHAFQAYAGLLSLNGGELQNSIANTASVGSILEGGEVYLNGVIVEVDVPFSVSGKLYINGGRIQNTQSITPQFYIASSANAGSVIEVNDCHIFRSLGTGNFSAQPLVSNAGSSDTIDITFKDCQISDWASFVQLANDNQQSVRVIDCKYFPDGTQNQRYDVYKLNTDGQDITDFPIIDKKGYTTNGFYLTVDYGGGTTMTTDADVPNAYYANSIEVAATGQAFATTADGSSLPALQASAYPVTELDNFMIEGWFKIVDTGSGTNAGAGIVVFDAAGTLVTFYDALSNSNNVMTTDWKYLRGVVQIPSGSGGVYAGFGIRGTLCTVRMAGIKVRRANWNIN